MFPLVCSLTKFLFELACILCPHMVFANAIKRLPMWDWSTNLLKCTERELAVEPVWHSRKEGPSQGCLGKQISHLSIKSYWHICVSVFQPSTFTSRRSFNPLSEGGNSPLCASLRLFPLPGVPFSPSPSLDSQHSIHGDIQIYLYHILL